MRSSGCLHGRGRTVAAVVAGTTATRLVTALAALAVVTEVFDFEPFPNSRISLTIALIVAAATLSALTGVVVLATAATIADFVAHKKASEKAIFNFGALLLSGTAYVGVMQAFSPDTSSWAGSLWPALMGTVAAYAVNSGLVALAISLDGGDHAVGIWQECFTWVLPYYLAMGAVGVSVAVAYEHWGIESILFLIVPFAIAWPILKLHSGSVNRRSAANPTA
jgi:hypothetical protein